MNQGEKFNAFCEVMDTLLGENGCPWDRQQTHKSLEPGFLEECYEVIDAIEHGSLEDLCEELGDVLLHIVLQGKIAEKNQEFTVADIIDGISKKMVRRHPHVFGKTKVENVDEIFDNWDGIKQQEKKYQNHAEKMQRVPKAFPALMRAYKIQKYAEKAGYGDDLDHAFEKIHEQIDALKGAVREGEPQIFGEFGDLLFKIVDISRFLGLNPEFALTNAVEKFINRFEYAENMSFSQNDGIASMPPDNADKF